MILSRSVLLRMKDVSEKSCGENQNTLLHSKTFFQNHAVYEITWKNIVEREMPQMRTTNTHPEYVILIAFSLQHGCTNAARCYVIRTLPVLLHILIKKLLFELS